VFVSVIDEGFDAPMSECNVFPCGHQVFMAHRVAHEGWVLGFCHRQAKCVAGMEARKYKADAKGNETEVAINDYIDIAAFAKPARTSMGTRSIPNASTSRRLSRLLRL
jgi:hypothetical protein